MPGIGKWQRKTETLEEEIIEALRESSFAGVERKLGVGYQAQVKLLRKAMRPLEGNWLGEKDYQGDLSLGLDEHSFSGNDLLLTITNLTSPRLVSILPDDRKATLDAFCQQIPSPVKTKIKSFCIDMKAMYRSVIKKNFPQAKIVIDHFHLIYDANKRIDEERRILQQVHRFNIPRKLFLRNKENLGLEDLKKLNWWFAKAPDLKVYWFVKESLREIYQLKERNQAQEKLITLIKMMYGQKDRGLTQWADALANWQEEILNFFDYRITNAYTEGIHTKLKLIKRLGFGFKNKQVYIRKAALACLPLTLILPHFS